MAPVILRPATPADHDVVARIWLDGWLSTGITLAIQPDYDVLRQRIDREVAGGWIVTVAEIDQHVVGFVAFRPPARQLEQIFVAPGHHRQRVGAALLAEAQLTMPDGFELWTHADNHRAAAFYAAQGMALLGPGTHPRHGHAILTFAMPALPA